MITRNTKGRHVFRDSHSKASLRNKSVKRSAEGSAARTNEASFRSLLVPLDGTLLGEHAIPYAVEIARRTGAVVRLAHVHSRLDNVEPWLMALDLGAMDPHLSQRESYLRDLAERIRGMSDVLVDTILIDDYSIEKGLADAAADVDLVILSSRRPGRIRRALAPSVADRIRRRLPCPTLVVREGSSSADFSSTFAPKNILVPLDGSRGSARILEPALKLATGSGAALTLLNVQDESGMRGEFVHDTPSGYLIGHSKTIVGTAPVTAHILKTKEKIADAIIGFSESCGADLIAVATEGGDVLSRLLRSSVADLLLRKSNLPILVLGPRRKEALPKMISVFP